MRIEYSKNFIKDFKRCPDNIKNSFKLRLEIFIKDKNYPLLNNHQLIGELRKYRSLNITGDWRAIFEEIDEYIVYFVAIGTHSQLYN